MRERVIWLMPPFRGIQTRERNIQKERNLTYCNHSGPGSLRIKFSRLVNQQISEKEWVSLCDHGGAEVLKELTTQAAAQEFLRRRRMIIGTSTKQVILKEYGCYVGAPLSTHSHVSHGRDANLEQCMFKALEQDHRKFEFRILQAAQSFLPNPFVCQAVERDITSETGVKKFYLLMPDSGA